MAKIITDNIAYAKVIRHMGFRTNAATTSFAALLPEDLEAVLKAAAEISMGTEISDSDIAHINSLCDQVISISAYRQQLSEYLRNRMNAIAPNLTALVGELVGARLISHAGSLLSLAKHPASTVQILGAEKALFRALKAKHDTPKYGLIYHASLIGQAPPKLKGKMARMVATKAALSIRVDALTDAEGKSEAEASAIGVENRAKLESRLRALEYQNDLGGARRFADSGRKQQKGFQMAGETKTYNTQADAVDLVPAQREDPKALAQQAQDSVKEDKRRAKEEKKAKKAAKKAKKEESDESEADENAMDVDEDEETKRKREKKEKKRKRRESEAVSAVASSPVKVCSFPSSVVRHSHSHVGRGRVEGGAQGTEEGREGEEGSSSWRHRRCRRTQKEEEKGRVIACLLQTFLLIYIVYFCSCIGLMSISFLHLSSCE